MQYCIGTAKEIWTSYLLVAKCEMKYPYNKAATKCNKVLKVYIFINAENWVFFDGNVYKMPNSAAENRKIMPTNYVASNK